MGLATLNPGCGSGEPAVRTTPVCVGPPTSPDCIIGVDDRSFVQAAGAITDGVSTATVSYVPGRYCMSGRLDPGPTNMNWGAILALPLTGATPTGIDAPFGAAARGIAQVQFTIDPPPIAGLTVAFAAIKRADCLTIPDCFPAEGFRLADASGAPTIVDNPGTVTAALSSFVQPPWGDPSLSFDPDLIANLQFQTQLRPDVVLDYDFCVRDVRFLDAAGREVAP